MEVVIARRSKENPSLAAEIKSKDEVALAINRFEIEHYKPRVVFDSPITAERRLNQIFLDDPKISYLIGPMYKLDRRHAFSNVIQSSLPRPSDWETIQAAPIYVGENYEVIIGVIRELAPDERRLNRLTGLVTLITLERLERGDIYQDPILQNTMHNRGLWSGPVMLS